MTRFKNYIEYDRYMRPVCNLGHCYYKGGGGTSTTINKRDIPNQSAQEADLERRLMDYGNSGLAGATDLQAKALDYINKTYNPDWGQLYNQYNGDINAAVADFKTSGDANLANYAKALQGNQDWFAKATQDYANNMRKDTGDNLAKYDADNRRDTDAYKGSITDSLHKYEDANAKNLSNYKDTQQGINKDYATNQQSNLDTNAANNSAILADYAADKERNQDRYERRSKRDDREYMHGMWGARDRYNTAIADAGKKYDAVENPAYSKFLSGMGEVNAGMRDVSNGILAGDYAKNRRAALQDDLDATTGSLLSNMARRGIINSSVTNSGFDSINQSVSDTLAKNYSSDLAQQAGLLGNRGSLLQSTYNTAHGKATDERNNAQTLATNGYGMDKDYVDKIMAHATDVTNTLFKSDTDYSNNVFGQKNANEQNRYKNQAAVNDNNYRAGTDANDKGYNAGVAVNDKNYGAETTTAKSILDYNLGNNSSWYKGAQDNTNSYYSMLDKNVNAMYAANNANAGNYYNAANGYNKDVYNARQGAADKSFSGAATAQAQSYYAPARMLDLAQNLYLPSQNQYNTMYSGRMGSAGTTSTTSKPNDDSSLWGAAGSLGAAAITACFVGDSLVAVPGGAVPIRDIKAGDTVLSLDDDDRICKRRVLAVNKPVIQPIVDVEFENGAIWHTTDTQRAYTAPWFEYVERAKKPAVTMDGQSKIVNHERTNKQEFVYDIVVEDRNIFFVNGIAAEGFGD